MASFASSCCLVLSLSLFSRAFAVDAVSAADQGAASALDAELKDLARRDAELARSLRGHSNQDEQNAELLMGRAMMNARFNLSRTIAGSRGVLRHLASTTTPEPSLFGCDGEGGRLCGFIDRVSELVERYQEPLKIVMAVAALLCLRSLCSCIAAFRQGSKGGDVHERNFAELDEVWFRKPTKPAKVL
eukprot:TRINITY_DN8552_c0_g4_i1.p1 TRINITY_DN8552_c0_g4~~TRINITY_DN8552_c0_g4_i1.p1  ORF type:complete len:188 (-),score=37.70 TRINITY_DN8552_c0_g4_i1:131-694(-)